MRDSHLAINTGRGVFVYGELKWIIHVGEGKPTVCSQYVAAYQQLVVIDTETSFVNSFVESISSEV